MAVTTADTTLPLEPESARLAGELTAQAAGPCGLSGKPLDRLLMAVQELAESAAVLACALGVTGTMTLGLRPHTGWLTVELTLPAGIPLDPVFDHKDAVLEELPGLKVMPDIFWRRIILHCVDKAQWTQSPRRITVSLTQYARPEDRPGELYFLGLTPRPAPNLAVEFVADELAVAVAPDAKSAYRIQPRMAFVLQAVDGKTPVREIYSAFVARFGMAHPATVGRIVEDLAQLGLIVTGDPLAEAPRSAWERARNLAGRLLSFQYSLPAPDRWVSALDRAMGALWSPLLALPLLLAAVLAIALTQPAATSLFEAMDRGAMIGSVLSTPASAAAFVVGLNVAVLLHELSHAMACKHCGGRVHAFGLMIYCGILCPFVDTTDAWMFKSKWRRMAVSLAGPAMDVVSAALALSLAALASAHGLAHLTEALAALALFLLLTSARNLVPLLQVDGYYALADLLEAPNLRPRSFAATKGLALALVGVGDRKPADFRGQWGLVAYGAACLLGLLLLIVVPAATLLAENLSSLHGPLAWVLSAVFVLWAVSALAEAGRAWYRRTRLKTINLKGN